MSFEPANYYDVDGHPYNVPRKGRYHSDDGMMICGECAVDYIFYKGSSWDTEESEVILAANGYERDEYVPGAEEPDWCCNCGADFQA